MQKTIIALLILVCCACSRQDPLSSPKQRAELMSEQIIDRGSCQSLRSRLGADSIDDKTIDEIYIEATEAHCINKDI